MEGFPFVGESFPVITMEQAMRQTSTPSVLQFGSLPPMVGIEHGSKTHYHPTLDPTFLHTAETKKAKKHAAAKDKEERQALIIEARNLLKNTAANTPSSPSTVMQEKKN